ncbi:Hypothetical protein SMAX5B_014107 [Scophthalmus maximus]|uniref:Uncharacterized protein n=1 Tax=Scophthalmus maximus TaxID=52904 RepID=A0A2U9BGL0_SCOMX|nr:Hypothetical protein SMAX5B_014107 [Scophthalmus maximus]
MEVGLPAQPQSPSSALFQTARRVVESRSQAPGGAAEVRYETASADRGSPQSERAADSEVMLLICNLAG